MINRFLNIIINIIINNVNNIYYNKKYTVIFKNILSMWIKEVHICIVQSFLVAPKMCEQVGRAECGNVLISLMEILRFDRR